MEETHATKQERLSRLIAALCNTYVWSFRVGLLKHQNIKPIKIKKHGRKMYNLFKYGVNQNAKALNNLLNFNLFDDCIKILLCT